MAFAAVMNGPTPTCIALDDADTRRCQSCASPSLVVDWKQGDCVCTNCGVVNQEHLMDDRPEWREFTEDDGKTSSCARSGLVVNDDRRYLGGLPPTTLSKHIFHGSSMSGHSSRNRKHLLATNHKMDRLMEKMHKRALKNTKLTHQVKRQQLQQHGRREEDDGDPVVFQDDTVRPEYEQFLIQEEEDVQRVEAALQADKWSLERALRLHAPAEHVPDADAEEVEDLRNRLNASLQRACRDLYCAYSMVTAAAQRLHLPDRVTHEATRLLSRYASRKDGLTVRGVASKLESSLSTPQQQESQKQALKDYNKLLQMGALSAALLFLTARNLGWPRSLVQVCESIQLPEQVAILFGESLPSLSSLVIKRKHCSRAMTELRELFPDCARSVALATNNSVPAARLAVDGTPNATSVTNFLEHAIRKLQLPPVAQASVNVLVMHLQGASFDGNKLSTLCASITYFVSAAGEIMQRLANQATQAKNRHRRPTVSSFAPHAKRRKRDREPTVKEGDMVVSGSFDILKDSNKNISSEQKAYEMRRMWDAWADQMPWKRSLASVEHSCGVSQSVVLEYYRSKLYPERETLLQTLAQLAVGSSDKTRETEQRGGVVLSETPLASVLLPHICVAASLMKE